jgi:hypothetical protein
MKIIERVADTFQEIITQWIWLDDNKEYLRIAMENRLTFTESKTVEDITKKCSTEDFIRFTWFLKNITYYNKRFLIPK